MAEIGSAWVSVIPSAKGFGTSLQRQTSPQLSKSGAALGAGLGKSMLKGFIAIGAGIQIAQFLGDSVAEAREAQKIGELTANVIKTTGGAAKVTAAQVGRLADAVSKKTGIDDEQIQSAENLILTFKNIRREGEGLDNIFGRATRAAVDLSASGFGDTASTAKQLGKALNDPVKGISALTRSGVTFTEGQKDQIKALVESGDTLKAQKIILAEVESQVKGSAEAQATSADKARVALGNLKEQIGTALLPAVDGLANIFTTKIAPAISGFITNLQSGKGQAGAFGDLIRNRVLPVLSDLWDYIVAKVVPAYKDALKSALDAGKEAFNRVRDAVARNKPQMQQLFEAAKKIAKFFYERIVPVIGELAGQALKRLGRAIEIAIEVAAFLVDAYNKVKGAFERVRGAVQAVIDKFTSFATAVRQKVSNAISTVRSIPNKIKSAIGNLGSLLYNAGRDVINGLIDGIKSKASSLASTLGGITSMIPQHKGPPAKDKVLLYESGQLIMDGLIGGIRSKEKELGESLEKVGKKLKEKISKIRDSLATAKSEFASLVEPIASNFTQGLFDFETAGDFVANLTSTKGTLGELIGAFKTLVGAGLKPGFLYQLFQNGGAGLILDLAKDPALAAQAGSLFADVTSLSDELGTSVAGATDKGGTLENQTVRLEKKLDKLTHAVNQSAERFGRELNASASNGRRRAA